MVIRFIDLCSGIGGFHSGLMATGNFQCVGHAEIDKHAAKAYRAIYGSEGGKNYGDLRKINPKGLPDFDLLCAGQIFPLGSSYAKDLKQLIPGAQGQRVYETDGVACTQCASAGGWGGKTGLYFIDMNVNPKITDVARCITARQDSGVSNHRGEHSAVLIEDEPPRATLTPDREKVRQQGRRMKEPDEAMFTITAQDRHGIYHRGRIRKLMPIECWRLQGFTDEQFNKAQATGLKDGHLYKMAGNAVSVPVITAIGQKIAELNSKYDIAKEW